MYQRLMDIMSERLLPIATENWFTKTFSRIT